MNEIEKAEFEIVKMGEKTNFKERIGTQRYGLHLLLFVLTLITTTISGAFWVGRSIEIDFVSLIQNFKYGLPFSLSFLAMLTFHEFGHFFAAVYHSVKVTLPYYIPVPPVSIFLNIGTLGAVIRIKERMPNSHGLFDIGIYGPIAGFVVAFALLFIGFATLPDLTYIYTIHPEYYQLGFIPDLPNSLAIGKNLLYFFFETAFNNPNTPPVTEMYHYPFLFAGWLGCMVTGLNLLPVGQLDGGHIIYAMFGRKTQVTIAKIVVGCVFILGMPAFLETIAQILILTFDAESIIWLELPRYIHSWSWGSWVVWGIILVKVVKIEHPPVMVEMPLDATRMKIGWLGIVIFVLCFTPVPFSSL